MFTKAMEQIKSLKETMHSDRLIITTNRGPVEYYLSSNETLKYRQPADSIGTVLAEVGTHMELTWIAMTMTEGDRIAFKAMDHNGGFLQVPLHGRNIQLRLIAIPETAYHKYYEKMSNQILWFLQHYMHCLKEKMDAADWIQDAWTNGYCVANQAFADAISAEINREESSAIVMLHDYHLYLIPSIIRNNHPSIIIQQFIHIPWPDIRYWHFLPSDITQSIFTGLVGNDIIGFQTELDARNFLEGACRTLEGAVIDFKDGMICWKGHRTQVRTYPISISVARERRVVQSQRGRQAIEEIRPLLSEKTIMRVDRIEPTKNIVYGFKAYAKMLDEHPELYGKVTFLAFLVPSRQALPIYQDYKAAVTKIIKEINQRYGSDQWIPILAFVGNNRIRALAALQFYDVLLVNSVIDGMNLVAKEGPAVNLCDGVLVLSRTTGAFQQLGKASIPISPIDLTDTAQAMYKALTLSRDERRIKATLAREEVERHDLNNWLEQQIYDINELLDSSSLPR